MLANLYVGNKVLFQQNHTVVNWWYQLTHVDSSKMLACLSVLILPSVLWCCWLGGRKGIRPVKIWVVGCWCGCLSGARCRLAYGPADATATHCHFSKIQIGFTFLVLAHLGSPGKRAVKWVCVCLSVLISEQLSFAACMNVIHRNWWTGIGHRQPSLSMLEWRCLHLRHSLH